MRRGAPSRGAGLRRGGHHRNQARARGGAIGSASCFLDKRNQIIPDELRQKGTVDHTRVYVREAVKRALELSSRRA